MRNPTVSTKMGLQLLQSAVQHLNTLIHNSQTFTATAAAANSISEL